MKTPAEELGYSVGMLFEIINWKERFPFSEESIIRLSYDDGSESPIFDLISGSCNYNLGRNKSPGAFFLLSNVKRVTQ